MARGGQTLDDLKKISLEHFIDKDVDLTQFFNNHELQEMSFLQQRRLKNIAQNYEVMLYMGLPAIKPDFMKGPAYKAKQAKLREQTVEQTMAAEHKSDSDTDETWTPDMERMKRAKRSYPSFVAPKKQTSKDTKGHTKSEKKPVKQVAVKRVYDFRERTAANFMNPDVIDDDRFVYCEECNKEYDMDCPVHGPLDYIRDTEVPIEYDRDRALHSLPPGLIVKASGILGAGLGVFTEKEIPARVMFGPYGGVRIYDKKKAHDSGYCWQIYADGKPSHFVDAEEKATSNWMRYVNCAPSETEQNLVAFQFNGGIYYRSYKTIKPGTELLCWYGNEYGRELGLIRDKNLLIKSKPVNGEECYPCVFCKIAFSTAASNVRHLIHKHGGDKLTQSDVQVLDEWLRKNDAEEYRKRRTKHSKQYRSKENDVLGQYRDGDVNKIKLSREVVESVKCEMCGKSVVHEGSITSPIRIRTEEKPDKSDICTCNQSNDLKMHTGEKPYKCDVCGYACNYSCHLKTHMRMHTGEKPSKCDVCGYTCKHSCHLKTHMRTHTGEKPYKCDVCGYTCKQSCSLKTHMRTHTGEKPYKCDVCGYTCNQSCNLKYHMRMHTGEKPYKCDVCGYTCKHSGSLKYHMRTHTGEKPYKCDVCGYTCKHSGSLKYHMRTHTGEKPYKCDVCGYTCKHSGSLKRHMRTHTGEKPYKCDVCGYTCKHSCSLKTHMRTHTGEKPYKCDVCGYTCKQSCSLKTHMRTHTGEKPYKCDVCGYTCKHSCNLKYHMRTHTGEKPYKCDVCGYACNQSSNLKTHMRTHKIDII